MTDPFLSDFLAAGVEADEVPELAALNTARPLLDAFITLFRGTEAEVLMRLLVLREIGREADVPRWSPDALRARFTYLDPVKLETVLKRLRDNALLAIGEDGHYALSDIGRNAVAAIAMLLRFGEEEDAELGFLTAQLAGLQAVGSITPEALGHLLSKLNDLTWHFEEAIASGSEFRILDARRRLSANGRWLERGTDILNSLLADPEVDFDIARIAQRIGLAQSRLARVDAAFQRALNKIESQRVTLGASGISSSDVSAGCAASMQRRWPGSRSTPARRCPNWRCWPAATSCSIVPRVSSRVRPPPRSTQACRPSTTPRARSRCRPKTCACSNTSPTASKPCPLHRRCSTWSPAAASRRRATACRCSPCSPTVPKPARKTARSAASCACRWRSRSATC